MIIDAPDRYLIPSADELEVVNVDGDDVVYFNAGFASGFNAASAGHIPTTPTVGGADYVIPAEPGEYVRLRVPREHNITVVKAISAGTPRIGVSLLRRGGERGDDEMSGGPAADYTPYTLSENASSADSVILGISPAPWAYYPMHDASGLTQDTSGNGRHMSSGSATAYQQTAITSKSGTSMRFNGNGFVMPKPHAQMGNGANAWTVIWLQFLTAWQGTGSPSNAVVLFGIAESNQDGPLCTVNSVSGDLYTIWRPTYATYFPESDLVGRVACIALVQNGNAQNDVYVDGVRWGASQTTTGAFSNNALYFGQLLSGGFWGWPDMRASNLAVWNDNLTHAQVLTVTEALMDSAGLATSYVP